MLRFETMRLTRDVTYRFSLTESEKKIVARKGIDVHKEKEKHVLLELYFRAY